MTVSLDLVDVDSLLTAEEVDVRAAARRFAGERVRPALPEWFESASIPARELAKELGALGFLGMHLTGYGCAGLGPVAYGLACLEIEAADSGMRSLVSVQGSLAMYAIWKYGSDEQKNEWLPRMSAGEAIGCFGLTEPDFGSNPAGMRTNARRDGGDWVLNGSKMWITNGSVAGVAVGWALPDPASGSSPAGMRPSARRDGGDWVLNGSKMWITNGSVADVAVVWARTDDGVRGFVVPTSTPGFSAPEIKQKMSLRASVTSELVLDDVRLPASAVLPAATGLRGPLSCLTEARFGIIWGSMGAARSAYSAALSYARERTQFGRPIGGFQLTQQKLANMALEYTKGVLLAVHLGRRKDAGELLTEQVSMG